MRVGWLRAAVVPGARCRCCCPGSGGRAQSCRPAVAGESESSCWKVSGTHRGRWAAREWITAVVALAAPVARPRRVRRASVLLPPHGPVIVRPKRSFAGHARRAGLNCRVLPRLVISGCAGRRRLGLTAPRRRPSPGGTGGGRRPPCNGLAVDPPGRWWGAFGREAPGAIRVAGAGRNRCPGGATPRWRGWWGSRRGMRRRGPARRCCWRVRSV